MRPRLLIIRYGGIGDAIQASSILPHLRAEGWHITWDASEAGETVLRHDPHIDAFLVTPHCSVPEEQLAVYWNARTTGFHRVINLCETVEVALLPTPKNLGFYRDDATRRRLYSGRNYLAHIHEVAGVPPPYRPWYFPTEAETAAAAAEIAGRRAVVLCLAGSAPYKVWPVADDVAATLLWDDPDAVVFLAGGTKDAHLAAAVAQTVARLRPAALERLVDMTGRTLRETLAVACLAAAVVGPETGILNAVAHRPMRKVVMLSHSSHENLTRDWENTAALRPQVPCHPCHRLHYTAKFCPRVPGGFAACAASFDVPTILRALAPTDAPQGALILDEAMA